MAAKAAAAKQTEADSGGANCAQVDINLNNDISLCLQSVQSFSTGAEKNKWKASGCSLIDGVWRSVDGKPCLPSHFFLHYAKLMYGLDHASKIRNEVFIKQKGEQLYFSGKIMMSREFS